MSTPDDARNGCAFVGSRPHCAVGLARLGEESAGLDRTFTLPSPGSYDLSTTATPRAGPALDALLRTATQPRIVATASSQAIADPLAGPQAAVDSDVHTGWVASPDDRDPSLTLRWAKRQTISSLTAADRPATRGDPAQSPCHHFAGRKANRRDRARWFGHLPSPQNQPRHARAVQHDRPATELRPGRARDHPARHRRERGGCRRRPTDLPHRHGHPGDADALRRWARRVRRRRRLPHERHHNGRGAARASARRAQDLCCLADRARQWRAPRAGDEYRHLDCLDGHPSIDASLATGG